MPSLISILLGPFRGVIAALIVAGVQFLKVKYPLFSDSIDQAVPYLLEALQGLGLSVAVQAPPVTKKK